MSSDFNTIPTATKRQSDIDAAIDANGGPHVTLHKICVERIADCEKRMDEYHKQIEELKQRFAGDQWPDKTGQEETAIDSEVEEIKNEATRFTGETCRAAVEREMDRKFGWKEISNSLDQQASGHDLLAKTLDAAIKLLTKIRNRDDWDHERQRANIDQYLAMIRTDNKKCSICFEPIYDCQDTALRYPDSNGEFLDAPVHAACYWQQSCNEKTKELAEAWARISLSEVKHAQHATLPQVISVVCEIAKLAEGKPSMAVARNIWHNAAKEKPKNMDWYLVRVDSPPGKEILISTYWDCKYWSCESREKCKVIAWIEIVKCPKDILEEYYANKAGS